MTKKQNLQVKVAKDVKTWITKENVKARNGYVKNNVEHSCFLLQGEDSKEIANLLKKNCEVCAKGALILSLVGLDNQFDFLEANTESEKSKIGMSHDVIMNRLVDVWDYDTLDLIETAFEANPKNIVMYINDLKSNLYGDDNSYDRALVFGAKYKSDLTRLHKIMDNIIENNGAFKP